MPAGPRRATRLRARAQHFGAALGKLGRVDEAIAALRQATALRPAYASDHHNLGNVLDQAGRFEEAKHAYRAALTINPALEEPWYDLAALGEAPPPPATPYSYLLRLFDSYAPSFDQHLVDELNYQAPEKLCEAVLAARPGATALDVIDLGCGTGLVGQQFRRLAARLTGIDVSAEMMKRAERRHIYDHLVLARQCRLSPQRARSRATWCWQVMCSSIPATWLPSFKPWPASCVPAVCSRFPWSRPRTAILSCSGIAAMPIPFHTSGYWPGKPASTLCRSIPSSSGTRGGTRRELDHRPADCGLASHRAVKAEGL